MSIYLLALTLSNTVILLSGPLRNWIHSVWETDIRYLSDIGCKVQLYLTYASIHISAWLLVAVTWERTLVMLSPMKALATFTARNTAVVILGICIVISAIDLIVPAMVTLHGVNNLLCAPKTKEWLHFRDSIYEWIDFFLMFAAPIVFLFVGNAIIIFKLQLQRKKIKKMCTFVEKNTSSGQGHAYVLVVALSYMYVVTITPVSVYHVYFVHRLKQIRRKFRQDPRGALEEFEFALLLQTIFYIWSYLNVTFNFALYVISCSRFRNDLLEMLQWKKTSKAPESHDPDVATVGKSSDNGSVMQSNYSLESRTTIEKNHTVTEEDEYRHPSSRTSSAANFADSQKLEGSPSGIVIVRDVDSGLTTSPEKGREQWAAEVAA
ncbi:B1 bradykinin receptor-like [Dreissena polymorpha]|uniref:B1 bradykinin receptor-like n=1 Tax=Dreissena polymorpha TaxID=45954 RepID=UPI002264F5A6|nr:B1 bradykinin receptor-like [Dreissena polymorpha]